MKFKWVREPVIEPLTPAAMYEHTPLDYYKYGEYPRFIRPIGAHKPRRRWMKLYEDGTLIPPGEEKH